MRLVFAIARFWPNQASDCDFCRQRAALKISRDCATQLRESALLSCRAAPPPRCNRRTLNRLGRYFTSRYGFFAEARLTPIFRPCAARKFRLGRKEAQV